MKSNNNLLDELRKRLPEYMAQRGQVVGERGKKMIRCINPSHNDKTPSMNYIPLSRRLYCFGCGAKYDIFDVIGLDYPECDTFKKRLVRACELFGFQIPDTYNTNSFCESKGRLSKKTSEKTKKDSYGDWIRESIAAQGYGGAYFQKRGISGELCKKYSLFEMDGRAYLPIYNDGKCNCYCARAVEEQMQPRYKNSSGPMDIFGRDCFLKEGEGASLFITEAIFDALSIEECGFHAIALCGAGNVKRIVDLCRQYPAAVQSYRLFAAGDSDEAGKHMNRTLIAELEKLGISCEVFPIPLQCNDLNEALLKDKAFLQDALKNAADVGRMEYASQSAAAALDSVFDIAYKKAARVAAPTGFPVLDRVLEGGLYAGLYILGAISSVGKTSFLLQIADSIANQGTDVLFFSLEMGKHELIARSISRLYNTLGSDKQKDVMTARQILNLQPVAEEKKKLLDKTLSAYRALGENLFFREGLADIDVKEIRDALKKHVSYRGKKPVVIVDYLQILRPIDFRGTEKQNMDRAVVELKRISRDFDIPVFAISSFNRENYRNSVTMEAFKESGALEYSSDVLFGLQLTGTGESNFDLNAAKQKSPRSMELVMLKNRNGNAFAKILFEYDARCSKFTEKGVKYK